MSKLLCPKLVPVVWNDAHHINWRLNLLTPGTQNFYLQKSLVKLTFELGLRVRSPHNGSHSPGVTLLDPRNEGSVPMKTPFYKACNRPSFIEIHARWSQTWSRSFDNPSNLAFQNGSPSGRGTNKKSEGYGPPRFIVYCLRPCVYLPCPVKSPGGKQKGRGWYRYLCLRIPGADLYPIQRFIDKTSPWIFWTVRSRSHGPPQGLFRMLYQRKRLGPFWVAYIHTLDRSNKLPYSCIACDWVLKSQNSKNACNR